MKTPFSLVIKLISLCGVVLFGALAVAHAAEPAPSIQLSAEENAYIETAKVVRMCVDPDWAPFERINEKGEHEGISADLIKLVAQRVGLKIELYPVKTWDESLAASKAKRCEIMSFLNKTPERDTWLNFTDPIFLDPNIIITREEHPYIGDIRGLRNETVALPRGTMVGERIRSDFPNLKIILTGNESESVALVSERKADMTIRSLIVAAYAIKKEGLFNLKISGQIPELTNMLRIGVLKGEPVLRDILDKGVKTITPQEREAISNKHVSISVQQGVDYSLVWKILAGAVMVLLIAAYWNRKLSTMNKELERLSLTDKLTGLFNRSKIDAAIEREIVRSQRFGQPFSLIMLDIDYFKSVNDTYGHQVGDKVLIAVSSVLSGNTRETDIVGRWGGEEFIVICPHTDDVGILNLAEGLRLKFEAYVFPVVEHKTASFGVTTYRKGDQPTEIVRRADEALYAAKNNGRNRVEVR
jgi:diguanylate cyclase (GGDEF)-like protein